MKSSAVYTLTDSERSRVSDVQSLREKGTSSVDELIGMLTDSSWVVRREVVEALAALDFPAVEALCDVLVNKRDSEARLAAAVDALVASQVAVEPKIILLANSNNPAIVADLAQVLGRRRNQLSLPVLVGLTRHGSDNVAVAAIEALGRIGGRAAVEALVETISSGNFFRTFPAIDVLGRSADPRVVGPLSTLLGNPNYLPEAARALGRTGEQSAVAPLVGLLDSSSDAIVRLAAFSLVELQERFEEKSGGDGLVIEELVRKQVGSETARRLGRVLIGSDTPEAVAICKLLGAIGSAEAEPLLLVTLNSAPPVAACAAEALKRIGRNSDGALLQAIREGTSARRKALLPVITRSAAAPDISTCLTDSDPEVKAMACDALARLGNARVVKEIFPLLSDTNLRVVHSATAAIQTLGNREARSLASEASSSPNPVVRRSALRILAYFGDSTAFEPMLRGLEDQDPRVREAALQGLPYLEDPRAVEAMFQSCKSLHPRTRGLAMRSLGQAPKASERTYSVLLRGLSDTDAWVRYYAAQSLGRLSFTAAAPELTMLLEDPAGQVRVSAVEALSHLNVSEAHEALRKAATSKDVEVKRAALVGLGIAHRLEDLPVVLQAASAPDAPTRLMALSAMVNFQSPTVLSTLSTAASDPDSQVSSAAIGYLAGRREQEATEILIELLAFELLREKAKAALLVPSEGRVAGLLFALESADDELSPILISILARLERGDGKGALLLAMRSNNVAARKAAASGLAARQDIEMLSVLREAAEKDPSREVREICSLLLRQ